MSKGFEAKVVSCIDGYQNGETVYAKVNSRDFRGVTSYKIVNKETGETNLVIDANKFANCFEKLAVNVNQ